MGGFEPLRIRPYVSLPHPGETDPQATQPLPPMPPMPPAQPVYGAVADPAQGHAHPGRPERGDSTPAYGTPAVWPDAPPQATWPAQPTPLPPTQQDLGDLGTLEGRGRERTRGGGGGGGGGGAPGKRSSSVSRRRRLPTVLAGAGTVVAVGTAALALSMLPRSAESDTVLLDANPTGPASSVVPTDPAETPSSAAPSPKASAARSATPSKSASPSPSASRSSAPAASPSPSSAPRTASSSPAAPKGPTLRHGDSGPEVEKLQRLLAAQGLYRGRYTGKYDDRTENAVAWFQWENDIEGDPEGVYGPQTRKVLEGSG
ncbi:peptidoglycan-binding protein [Streptomyces sp. NPDC127106]|uniref:peptidoglycan-binding domain-containing protein n=1 Tax=Streptomyces sp. NPDC127106 TaxID=3345360 RepID=UPI00362B7AB0